MKIPHTINSNYFKEYAASAAALQLIPDSSRILKSEDQTWDEFYPRRLNELCVAVLVANFQKRITLNEMPPWDRNLLLETLPTNLPLPLVTQHINDGIYWKRKVKDKWKDEANYCQDYDFNWKRMFLEKHVEEAVEAMTPEGFDLDAVEALCDLTKNYVKRLNLRELQVKQSPNREEEDEDEDMEEAIRSSAQSSDHIDLSTVILGLENLTELHVQFGVRNLGSDYKPSYFQFSLQDCRNLGRGVEQAQNLKLLRVHSCNLDDDRIIALLSSMEKNESLEAIDFSNCILGDDGASAVARFMKNRWRLKSVNLSNNRIREIGVSALAFIVTQSYSSPIESLNLRCNAFGDGGLKFLASALVREKPVINTLNLSCCNLSEESGIFLGEVLNRNSILVDVDLSNNHLGEKGGRALEVAMENNQTIQYLDVRETGLSDEAMSNIKTALHFNRIRALRGEKGVIREIMLMKKREEDERLRLEQLALEGARAAEEAAAKLAFKSEIRASEVEGQLE